MYFVCFACILQNVSVSMRLATFRAENTCKYIQYRQIQANTEMTYIHNTYTNTYRIHQLVCVCMRMYLYVFACILSVCMYFFTIYRCLDVSECMCMYLYVSVDCNCSPVVQVICELLGYIEYNKMQSTLGGVIPECERGTTDWLFHTSPDWWQSWMMQMIDNHHHECNPLAKTLS